jgi:F-type H+-transporting ATPase subunit epsilon
MAEFNCVVVTPEKTVLDEKVEFVALPLFDGEIGFAAGHSPMIGRLGFGEMRLRSGSTVRRYYVDGGFVQVADNVVSVLTNRSVPSSDLDIEVAKQQLVEAQKQKANTQELFEIRERTVTQARAQIRTAQRAN